jgi:hypothetical protein
MHLHILTEEIGVLEDEAFEAVVAGMNIHTDVLEDIWARRRMLVNAILREWHGGVMPPRSRWRSRTTR